MLQTSFENIANLTFPLCFVDGFPGPAEEAPGCRRWRVVGDGAQIVRNLINSVVSRVLFGRLSRTRPGGTGEPQMD